LTFSFLRKKITVHKGAFRSKEDESNFILTDDAEKKVYQLKSLKNDRDSTRIKAISGKRAT